MKADLHSLAFVLETARGCGKTYRVAQACKEIDATFICASGEQAKRIANEYGVKTAIVSQDLRGRSGPFLIDNFAVSRLLHEAADELQRVHAAIDEAREVLRIMRYTERTRGYPTPKEWAEIVGLARAWLEKWGVE